MQSWHLRIASLGAVIILMVVRPGVVRADGFLGPGVGAAFGNPATGGGRPSLVFDLGWLSREPVGVDLDATFAPNFFGGQGPYGSNSVSTLTANVILAAGDSDRVRRFRRFRNAARPYLTFGIGLIRQHLDTPSTTTDDAGANVGVGVMVVPRRQVGVRADLRYFHDLTESSGGFHFWRASVSLLVRFGRDYR